ncbi:MAG: DUF1064 domain-containing protein [Bacteroidales bacterium]|nr:DUF1064 domain-containing protein [Bacteroidales bacterium]
MSYKTRKQIQSYGERKAGRIPHNYVKVGDKTFDSQAEADRYMELLVGQKAGLLHDLECHPHFDLIPTQKVPGQKAFRPHGYTADFRYVRDGEVIVEDVKSERTREERDYIINRKLMWMIHGIYVHEVIR